nr:hypothetical protein [uncultured bacterium]
MFTIGLSTYLALPDGSGRFTQNFTCSALLRIRSTSSLPVYGAITRCGPTFQMVLQTLNRIMSVLQPQQCRNNVGLGWSPFARRY